MAKKIDQSTHHADQKNDTCGIRTHASEEIRKLAEKSTDFSIRTETLT